MIRRPLVPSDRRSGSSPVQRSYLPRLLHLGRTLVRHYVGGGLARTVHKLPGLGGMLRPAPLPERRLRLLLERLGGSFIKFGQVLSLQPDLVPREYCDELFDLLDRVPPFAFEDVERTFREDFGAEPGEVFTMFEATPFASASIGQVHRALVGGRRVAVKVRRPTALRDFGGDIRLMQGAVWLIDSLRLRRLEAFRMPINEFISWTSDELDYRTEARYMQEIHRNAGDREQSKVPAVFPNLSSNRVLTAEFLSGVTLLEYLRSLEKGDPAVAYRLESIGFDPDLFAENILTNFLGDVFQHGVFHADLHPANLLILPDNVVGYVDFGITGVISDYGREEVLALILALARHDVDELYEGLLRVSEVTDRSDQTRFRTRLRELANGWFERRDGRRTLRTSYTLIMLDLIRLSKDCRLLPHEEALRYMRSVITADGLIARFAPDFNVNEMLEKLSARHLRERALAKAFSADRLIEACIAGASLTRDGTLRLDAFIDHLEKRSRDSASAEQSTNETDSLAVRATRLALVLAVMTALVWIGPHTTPAGNPLAATHLALAGAATGLLLWTGLRWLWSGR